MGQSDLRAPERLVQYTGVNVLEAPRIAKVGAKYVTEKNFILLTDQVDVGDIQALSLHPLKKQVQDSSRSAPSGDLVAAEENLLIHGTRRTSMIIPRGPGIAGHCFARIAVELKTSSSSQIALVQILSTNVRL